jgi:tRNA threonylcarbamoyladenosine biosynthesis protein TsaB
MNILSIDTSGKSFSLTLLKDQKKTSFVDTTESVSSESVLVEIDKLVSECKITPKDISSVIYNNGPGSFTGVRVSSAIVQAIGFSNNCPVYGINSLMLIAYSEYIKNNVSKIQVIKKAFGDQVFHGLFHLTSDSCISNDPIKTSTFSDVEIDSNYVLITDDNNTIENLKDEHLPINLLLAQSFLLIITVYIV